MGPEVRLLHFLHPTVTAVRPRPTEPGLEPGGKRVTEETLGRETPLRATATAYLTPSTQEDPGLPFPLAAGALRGAVAMGT